MLTDLLTHISGIKERWVNCTQSSHIKSITNAVMSCIVCFIVFCLGLLCVYCSDIIYICVCEYIRSMRGIDPITKQKKSEMKLCTYSWDILCRQLCGYVCEWVYTLDEGDRPYNETKSEMKLCTYSWDILCRQLCGNDKDNRSMSPFRIRKCLERWTKYILKWQKRYSLSITLTKNMQKPYMF